MTEDTWRMNFEKSWRLFPTTENLRRLLGYFTHYLEKHFDGSHASLDMASITTRRNFIKEMAYKILSWFSLYRKDIVDGDYYFLGIEDRLQSGIIEKVRAGLPFDKSDFDAFKKIFDLLNGPYGYMVEVNGTTGIKDGVQNGGHIFRGIHVTGLPGGSVYEVMLQLYESHGGPFVALSSKTPVFLTNPQGDNINKLRMRVMSYIEIVEDKTKYEFPIEVKVSGEKLLVIPRGSNNRSHSKSSKESSSGPKKR